MLKDSTAATSIQTVKVQKTRASKGAAFLVAVLPAPSTLIAWRRRSAAIPYASSESDVSRMKIAR